MQITMQEFWQKLIRDIRADSEITIAYMAKVDENDIFTDFKYLLLEYHNQFFYIWQTNYACPLIITIYKKISPFEKIQASYSEDIHEYDIIGLIKSKEFHHDNLKDVHVQRVYLNSKLYIFDENKKTGLTKLKASMSENEKHIFDNLIKIEQIKHTNQDNILRFHSSDAYFDYDDYNQLIIRK